MALKRATDAVELYEVGVERQERYVSQTYVFFAVGTGLPLLLAADVIVPMQGATPLSVVVAVLLGACGLRALWVAWRAGVWIDPATQTVTIRGFMRTTRLNRMDISGLSIKYQGETDKWPRGYVEPEGTPLRALSVRHRHSPGQWGKPCSECQKQRVGLQQLGAVLGLPIEDARASKN